MICVSSYNSPLGDITLAGKGEYLTGLWFNGQKYFGRTLPERYRQKTLSVFDETKRWLDIYFMGENPDFTPPLWLNGSLFQQAVWNILLSIPYGHTMTYGEIANEIAEQKGISKMSAQAVGGAVSRNPVSIIVPCHRVIGSNGSMTGYAGGIDKKIKLLELEKGI